MDNEIIIAIIGLIGTVIVAYIQDRAKARTIRKLKHENEQAKFELDISRSAFDFTNFVSEWSELNKEILSLIEETEIDRFLILRAWNGQSSPKWTTAVLQIRANGQEPVQYIHFELDQDYIDKLNSLYINNYNQMNVQNLPNSKIKDVYLSENVKSSLWAMIDKREYESGHFAVTYCSFSTHELEDITESTATRCKIIADRLKGASSMFHKMA